MSCALFYRSLANIRYSVVAAAGPGAHPYESWTSHYHSHVMWLRDILPNDFPEFRVLSWGYESVLKDPMAIMSVIDISKQLLIALRTIRLGDNHMV